MNVHTLVKKNPGRWKRAVEQFYTNKSAKNCPKQQKRSKKIENKERKQLKKRNECAYLGEKNPGRWKRAVEQFYTNKSAKNWQKQQKKSQKIENKEKKHPKKRN